MQKVARNNLVSESHDEGTSDKSVTQQRSLPSPGMDSNPSAPLETSTSSTSLATMGKDMASGTNASGDSTREGFSYIHRRSSKEAADTYCNPQDPPDRMNLSTKEPTAMPVVATSSRDEDLITTIRISILRGSMMLSTIPSTLMLVPSGKARSTPRNGRSRTKQMPSTMSTRRSWIA